ncbi:MAG: NUDIX domain-containing protein [Erysipelotrichaceae bacterium]|nr:NUDIX domain-containing protein [Erysipelotrichaceae bacterium]
MEVIEIGRLDDDQYEFNGYTHIRYTARALMENEKGQFGFLHITGEDLFGERDHLETVGGGLEEGETLQETIKREIGEEAGFEVLSCKYVGTILDAYNIIQRITCSSFFHCKVNTMDSKETHRTEEEQELISEIVWLYPDEALDWLDNRAEHKVDKLVQRRDAMALRYYLEHL